MPASTFVTTNVPALLKVPMWRNFDSLPKIRFLGNYGIPWDG